MNPVIIALASMGVVTLITMTVVGVFLFLDRHPTPIDAYWGNDNPIPYTLREADQALQASRDRLDSYVKPINNHTRRV